jgi:hypothetical protein
MKSKTYGKKRNKKSNRRENTKKKRNQKKKMWGGFYDTASLTIFINYLSQQNPTECCIFDKLKMFNISESDVVSKNNESIDDCVKKVFECKKDVILIPFLIPRHANLIIIRDNVVEWFEPHGPKYLNDSQMKELSESFLGQFIDKLNETAIKKFKEEFNTDSNIKHQKRPFRLETPDILCPNDGFQQTDKFCMTWSLYVLVQIVKNPEINTIDVINNVLKINYPERCNIIKEFKKNYNSYVKQSTELNFDSMQDFIQKQNKIKTNIDYMQNMHNKLKNDKEKPITHAF